MPKKEDDLYITGIGASAGGVEALNAFFKNIPDKPGTAFVIIQHLAATQKGYLKDMMVKITELPITEVRKKTKLKKNHIYIIPPSYYLLLTDGCLDLEKRDPTSKVNDAIDRFFTSLADKAENRSIGIILSGLGNDGAKGSQKIKEKGGIVMVQAPNSASYSNMPLGTILSDHPDIIGPPEELANRLIDYLTTPEIIDKDQLNDDKQQKIIKEIINRVIKYSGVNFENYKINTILRRIDKRIKINHLFSLEGYLQFLKKQPEEIGILFNDLLIGVTEFFRDHDSFKTLKETVVPAICKEHSEDETLRIWVPACSTGEEAYSIAMLFEEYIRLNKLELNFKLFATDLNPKAVQIAGKGFYTEQICTKVPEDLLKRYFNKKDGYYEVVKELRKNIIFSVHNLLSDPPFIRLDLISCRNVFIYLKEEPQKKLLYTFNYSLNGHGYLMMGTNETDGNLQEIFNKINVKSKIFKNKSTTKRLRSDFISSFDYQKFIPRNYNVPERKNPVQEQENYAQILASKYAPDCLLLNESNEIVYTSGKIEHYLKFPNKRSNLNIFEMVKGNLSLGLRTGLRQVRDGNPSVAVRGVEGFTHEGKEQIDLSFFRNPLNNLVIIEFNSVLLEETGQDLMEVNLKESMSEIERLEAELYQSKKELQYNSDELEAINEELQSSNEEMKSSNEELQTTNEELQSTNEELKTVNLELQNKIDEITILHDDVNNLFISTQIGTIFLDRNLNIRKYTPTVQRYFNVREGDLGRPIHHYTYNFEYKNLKADIKRVMSTLEPLKKEIKDNNGCYAMLRMLPYKTDDMRIEGVILTFVDITELKESNLKLNELTSDLQKRTTELEQSEKYWKSLVENSPDIIARLDNKQNITFINESVQAQMGIAPSKLIGKKMLRALKSEDSEDENNIAKSIAEVFNKKKTVNFYQNFTYDGHRKYFYLTVHPEWNLKANEIKSVLLIARDITDLRDAELKIERKNKRLQEINEYMDSFVHAVAHDLRSPMTNLKLILELLEEEDNPNKKDILINRFSSSVNRIDNILNGLIEIIDNQSNIAEKSKVIRFDTIISQVWGQLKDNRAGQDKLTFNLQVENIRHIRGYIYSILRNLLSNAIKYKSPDRELKIKVSTKKEGKCIKLSIADNGLGMDLDHIKKDLFKPFKRFNSTVDGKGIGLHIIKTMVEKTGGKIEVESEVNKGSTFHVYLESINSKKEVHNERIND